MHTYIISTDLSYGHNLTILLRRACVLLTSLLLVGCGGDVVTQTPIYIVVTASPAAAPPTNTALVATSTPAGPSVRASLEAALRGKATGTQLTATVLAAVQMGSLPPTRIISAANQDAAFAAQGHLFFTRPSGSPVFSFGILISNLSSDHTLTVNPADFTIETVDGYTTAIDAATFRLDKPLGIVTLTPGTHTSGEVAFEIPEGAAMHYLIYRPSSLSGQTLRADFTTGSAP